VYLHTAAFILFLVAEKNTCKLLLAGKNNLEFPSFPSFRFEDADRFEDAAPEALQLGIYTYVFMYSTVCYEMGRILTPVQFVPNA